MSNELYDIWVRGAMLVEHVLLCSAGFLLYHAILLDQLFICEFDCHGLVFDLGFFNSELVLIQGSSPGATAPPNDNSNTYMAKAP